jgi:hypothetical protein
MHHVVTMYFTNSQNKSTLLTCSLVFLVKVILLFKRFEHYPPPLHN